MPKLYEITNEYARLMTMIAESEGEISEHEQAHLKELQGELNQKVENIAKLIKNTEADMDAFKSESKRLADKAKSLKNRTDWLKEYVKGEMARLKVRDVKGEVLTVRIRPSQPSCIILDEKAIPPAYFRIIPETREVNKKAIIEKYKEADEIVAGVEIARGETLTIR